jgi:hypothetical protein
VWTAIKDFNAILVSLGFNNFANIKPPTQQVIYVANGYSHIHISRIGSISSPILSISDTYLANILSIGQLNELGLEVFFSN